MHKYSWLASLWPSVRVVPIPPASLITSSMGTDFAEDHISVVVSNRLIVVPEMTHMCKPSLHMQEASHDKERSWWEPALGTNFCANYAMPFIGSTFFYNVWIFRLQSLELTIWGLSLLAYTFLEDLITSACCQPLQPALGGFTTAGMAWHERFGRVLLTSNSECFAEAFKVNNCVVGNSEARHWSWQFSKWKPYESLEMQMAVPDILYIKHPFPSKVQFYLEQVFYKAHDLSLSLHDSGIPVKSNLPSNMVGLQLYVITVNNSFLWLCWLWS